MHHFYIVVVWIKEERNILLSAMRTRAGLAVVRAACVKTRFVKAIHCALIRSAKSYVHSLCHKILLAEPYARATGAFISNFRLFFANNFISQNPKHRIVKRSALLKIAHAD